MPGDGLEGAIGVDGNGMTDGFQHGEVAGRIGVGIGQLQVVAHLLGEPAHRLGLSLAITERLGELTRVDPVFDLGNGADAPGHPDGLGEGVDDLDRRCRHDVGIATGCMMQVDQARGLPSHVVFE